MARYVIEGLARQALLLSTRQEGTLLPEVVAVACAGLARPGAASLGVARSFSTRAQWNEALEFSVVREKKKDFFKDAATVSGLLPNRKDFAAQFSPHGIALVPRAILDEASGVVQRADKTEGAVGTQSSGMACASGKPGTDKTKMWRRMKIKKHKIRKRRKMNRYKSD